MRILLVDDDEFLMASLAEKLIRQRYAVDIAVDGSSARDYVELFNYDLIVLDLMLPDGEGIEFCRQFRQSGYINPLMILTAKASTAEKVSALDAGADDYVIKPFDFDELCARIRALLRREHEGLPTVLQWGALQLDPSVCELTYASCLVRLTPKEFSLMELFLRSPYRVHSLSNIIDDLWSLGVPPGEDAVRTHIKSLRRKLREAGAPKDLIKTVYGLGYRLNENTADEQRLNNRRPDCQRSDRQPSDRQTSDRQPSAVDRATNPTKRVQTKRVQNALNRQSLPANRSPTATESAVKNALTAFDEPLADLSHQAACHYLHNAQQLITEIEKSVAAFLTPSPERPERHQSSCSRLQAQTNAHERARMHIQMRIHKLAGSLGSFGLTAGSNLAREIEAQIEGLISSSLHNAVSAASKADIASDESVQPPRQEVTQLIRQLRHYIDAAAHRACTLPTLRPTERVRDCSPTLLIISRSDVLIQALTQAAVEAGFSVQIANQNSADSADSIDDSAANLTANPQMERTTSMMAASIPDIPATDLLVWDTTTVGALSSALADETNQLEEPRSPPPTIALAIALVDEVTLTAQRELVAQGVRRVMSAQDSPAHIADEARSMVLAEGKNALLRVAIADDDPQFLSRIKAELEGGPNASNFWLKTFTDAQALWQWLHVVRPSSNASLPVDVLILDIEMPEMDGIELCRVLRADARFQQLPIVFLSIHDSEAIKEKVFQAGANDFISKASTPPHSLARWLQSRRFTLKHNHTETVIQTVIQR